MPQIFLVQPLDKSNYKEMIVYADSSDEARKAAALEFKSSNGPASLNDNSVYLDSGMSICISIAPNIIKSESNSGHVKVKYNEVIYELGKNEAKEVIAEDIL